MKMLIEEKSGQGLESLLGQVVTLLCECYIYTGKLVGVNEHDVLLADARIVYETGAWDNPAWSDAQKLPGAEFYVRTAKIESYGVLK